MKSDPQAEWKRRGYYPDGEKYDNGDEPSEEEKAELTKVRELAEYARENTVYTGFFVDKDELAKHNRHAPLEKIIESPHVTISFHPSIPDISSIIETLNPESSESKAKIKVIGYGDDGKNQGFLVKVTSDNYQAQRIINSRCKWDENDRLKPVPAYITISIAKDAKAADTEKLDFEPLAEEEQFELTGKLGVFRKDGVVIYDKETIENMKEAGEDYNRK